MSRRRPEPVANEPGKANEDGASNNPRPPVVPLSPQQRRFLKTVESCLQYEQMLSGLCVHVVVTLERRCARQEILDALRRLLETYDALRLVVEPEGNEFVQRLHPVDDGAIERIVRFHDDLEVQEVLELLLQYAGEPIAFARPLMLRVYALSHATHRTTLMLMISHIIADGVSAQIIGWTLEQFLAGEGESERLSTPSFVDYCMASSRADEREAIAASKRYWCEMFAAPYRPFAFLKINSGAPLNYLYRDNQPPEDVKGLSERFGVRTFSLSFFAFAVSAAIKVGRNDLVLNYFSHGRQGRADLKAAVGCYYVPLPLRFMAKADDPIDVALRSFEDKVRAGVANQRYDVSMIIDELFGGVTHPAEDNFPLTTLAFNGISLKHIRFRPNDEAARPGARRHVITKRMSLYDATFYLGLDDSSGAQLSAIYRADKFLPEEMDDWSEVFWKVIAALRDGRASTVGELLAVGEPLVGQRIWTRARAPGEAGVGRDSRI